MEFSDPSLVGVCLMRFDDIQDRPRSGGHCEVGRVAPRPQDHRASHLSRYA
jgi:hypothetical protein